MTNTAGENMTISVHLCGQVYSFLETHAGGRPLISRFAIGLIIEQCCRKFHWHQEAHKKVSLIPWIPRYPKISMTCDYVHHALNIASSLLKTGYLQWICVCMLETPLKTWMYHLFPIPFPTQLERAKWLYEKKKIQRGIFLAFRIAITEQPFVRLERILIPQG